MSIRKDSAALATMSGSALRFGFGLVPVEYRW